VLLIIEYVASWMIPVFLLVVIIFGLVKKVNLFDCFVEGAKEGFPMAVKLIPFLVGMLVAIGLFRQSGAMELLANTLQPLLNYFGVPGDILPLALMRPVSGSGALAITTEIMQTSGPDSFLGRLASTMLGSTDTTLFVLTVYFGAVGVYQTRHALPVGLLADLSGIIAAIFICSLVFG